MYPLVLLSAAALRLGAQALTLGRQSADHDEAGDGPPRQRADAALEACLAAAGLPDCPQRGGVDSPGPLPGCLDSALLAEDMSDLGFDLDAVGCARAAPRVTSVGNPNPLAWTPVAGQVPRANVSHTKPVIWVHIHKSMGTFIYMLARSSGENVVQPSFNGNWWPYDTPPDGGGRKIDCSKRREYYDWANATWGQIEHQMEDWSLCHKQFNYGVLLRDPNKLAISKASMERYSSDETIASLSCLVGREHDNVTDLTPACNRAAPAKHAWKLWWFWDNFAIRMLAGGAVWGLPAGAITEEHADKAIQRLSKFDVVMFAEDFEKKEYLERAIGWRPENYEKTWKRPSTHVVELTHEQEAQARFTNRFDYKVYDHFRSMPMQKRVKKFQ